jgi:hypothetical protein
MYQTESIRGEIRVANTRERRTPQQRAQDELETAQRVLETARKRKERIDAENPALIEKYERILLEKKDEVISADAAVTAAEKRVAFLQAHPDLVSPDQSAEQQDDVL